MPEAEPKKLGFELSVKEAERAIGVLEQRFTKVSIGYVHVGDRTFDLTVRSAPSGVDIDLLVAHARAVLEQNLA